MITNPNILYLEDDPAQASLVQRNLKKEHFHVTLATSVESALSALDLIEFDLVLTDYRLPDGDGLSFIRTLRKKGFEQPVIMMSVIDDLDIAVEVMKLGANDFISKDTGAAYLKLLPATLTKVLDGFETKQARKTAEQELTKERTLARSAVEHISQGLVVYDNAFKLQYCNAKYAQLFNLSDAQTCPGTPMKALLRFWFRQNRAENNDVIDIDALLKAEQTFLAKEDSRRELQFPNGRIMEMESHALPDGGYAVTYTDITARNQEIQHLRLMLESAPLAIIALNAEEKIVLANKQMETLFGYDSANLINQSIEFLIPESFRSRYVELRQAYKDATSEKKMMKAQGGLFGLKKDGSIFPIEVSLSPFEGSDWARVIVVVSDISLRKEAERALVQAHRLQQSIIDSAPFSILATDENGVVVAVSPMAERMLWYAKEELIGKQSILFLHDHDEVRRRAAELSEELGAHIEPGFEVFVSAARREMEDGHEWTYIRKDGSRFLVQLTVTALRNPQHEITGFLAVAYDITERKRAENYIKQLAHFDYLTNLPNRTLLQDRLNVALLRSKRHGERIGLMMIDLDHFKRINDSLGHQAGDEVLQEVAKRIKSTVRESDTVARMGGDEFVVLVPDLTDIAALHRIASDIVNKVSQPIKFAKFDLHVSPSIGVAISPDDGNDAHILLKNADTAMYVAKNSGRSNYQLFSREMALQSEYKLQLEQALRVALERNELEVYYQPQIDLTSGKASGVEALLRWHHPKLGIIQPAEFIPLAEEIGLIIPMGNWVLHQACAAIKQLRAEIDDSLVMAINLSPRQFLQKYLAETIKTVLDENRLPPDSLELEITESVLMMDTEETIASLKRFSEIGLKLVVDDFGTGYSSLSYITRFTISRLKIDKSFVEGITHSENSVAVVNAIVSMAHGLGIGVIAEGVETLEQLEQLKRLKGDYIQGYFYARPAPLNQTIALMLELNNKV